MFLKKWLNLPFSEYSKEALELTFKQEETKKEEAIMQRKEIERQIQQENTNRLRYKQNS